MNMVILSILKQNLCVEDSETYISKPDFFPEPQLYMSSCPLDISTLVSQTQHVQN